MKDRKRAHVQFALLTALLVGVSATTITSCDGGGGDADGRLCSECGVDPDGPCLDEVEVSGDDAAQLCDEGEVSCTVRLTCRRKADSAQRRCFPLLGDSENVNPSFECDGSRPGGTALPEPTITPTPMGTMTPDSSVSTSPAATPTPTDGSETCNNNVLDQIDECDTVNGVVIFAPEACDDAVACSCAIACGDPSASGDLGCTDCQIDTTGCTNC
jgi:hypothetical protein